MQKENNITNLARNAKNYKPNQGVGTTMESDLLKQRNETNR